MARGPITRANPYTPKAGAFAGETFHSERQYRNALARRKGYRSWHHQQRSRPSASGPRAVASLSRSERQARERALRAVNRMRREGLSVAQAARQEGTTRNTIMRHAGSAVESRGGRMRAKPADRLTRRMNVLGPQGLTTVTVRGSRQATVIAEHWNAIRRYVNSGDDSELRRFYGRTVGGVELESDPDVIDQLAAVGALDFEDIYELTR